MKVITNTQNSNNCMISAISYTTIHSKFRVLWNYYMLVAFYQNIQNEPFWPFGEKIYNFNFKFTIQLLSLFQWISQKHIKFPLISGILINKAITYKYLFVILLLNTWNFIANVLIESYSSFWILNNKFMIIRSSQSMILSDFDLHMFELDDEMSTF